MMTAERPAPTAAPARRPALALVLAVLTTVPYSVGLVLPYYANGLHRRPAGETLYAYDLGTLWPYDTALGGVVAFVALVGMPMFPFVTIAVAAWSGFNLWYERRVLTWRDIALYSAAAVVALASIGWLTTPLASELFVWFVD